MIELLKLLPYLLLFYINIKIPLFDLKLIILAQKWLFLANFSSLQNLEVAIYKGFVILGRQK
jgi:hypothetical protein